MEIHLLSYYIGILLIFLVNSYTLVSNSKVQYLPQINIFAGMCIAYYFINKEFN